MDRHCLAKITNYRETNIFSGYRPAHLIRDDYLTTGMHEYVDCESIKSGEFAMGYIQFISPEVYPRTLYPGRIVEFFEGRRKTGEIEIFEVYNNILSVSDFFICPCLDHDLCRV